MIDLGFGIKLLTRNEWGARPPKSVTPLGGRLIVTFHWEGPTMGLFPHSSCATKVRGIQRYHMDSKGWQDIAYNALFCPHGYVFEGRGRNVRSAANGTFEGNSSAYAICYLSGQGDPFTDIARVAGRQGAAWLANTQIRNCHRDWKSTECPGNVICAWVKAGGAKPIPTPPPEPPPLPMEDNDMALVIAAPSKGPFLLSGSELCPLDADSRDRFRAAGVPYVVVTPLVYDRMWRFYSPSTQEAIETRLEEIRNLLNESRVLDAAEVDILTRMEAANA